MIRGKNRIRVAKYKRVSTDEQRLKKNSIIAQDELLDEYIKNHPEMVLVGDFSDEGVSGTKIQRTELQSLLEMVEADEVDVILVTKLDRWFRNVAFYYRVQEVLERNKVAWKTILEDYDTLAADGRLKVNIMLSVAQNEAERTSERIKVVFDSKVRNKQAITGALPMGFTTIEGNGARKVVKDPQTEQVVYDIIEHMLRTHSVRGTVLHINETYELNLSYNKVHKLLKNTMLYGEYHGVADYCEAYMTKREFEELQACMTKNIKRRETNRYYMFSGLLLCPQCGRKLSGTFTTTRKPNGNRYHYLTYRCPASRQLKTCDFKKNVSENVLERKVLAQVLPQFERLVLDTEIEEVKKKPRINKTAAKDEMDRLNKMYQKGRIQEEDYDRQYEILEKKLIEREEPRKDYSEIQKILDGNFKKLYETFDNEEKQVFWRSIVDTIEFDDDDVIIHFL